MDDVSAWHDGPGGREVLDADPDRDRPRFARSRVAAPAVLAVVAVLGLGIHRIAADPATRPAGTPDLALSAGMLVETTDADPAAMVVPFWNGSPSPVTVRDLRPAGWRAYGDDVVVPGRSWVDIPIWLTLQCGRMPPPTDRLALRTVSGGVPAQRTVAMPGVPRALTALRGRLCTLPPARDVRRPELVGTWLVEEGRRYAGHLLVRFDRTGRFRLAPRDGGDGAFGTFSWEGSWVRLTVRAEGLCAPGDSILWQVGVLPDGRLRIGHVAYYDDACRVDEREVWVARRADAATS